MPKNDKGVDAPKRDMAPKLSEAEAAKLAQADKEWKANMKVAADKAKADAEKAKADEKAAAAASKGDKK